jgi:hypothetical protein
LPDIETILLKSIVQSFSKTAAKIGKSFGNGDFFINLQRIIYSIIISIKLNYSQACKNIGRFQIKKRTMFRKRKFNINSFIKDILNNKYALIIGPEIILDTTIEPTGDIHQYFLNIVNKASGTSYSKYNEIALDKSERINPVRQLVESAEVSLTSKIASPELKALIKLRLFNTVLTTTTDGVLESVMKDEWGNALRVVNVYDKESVDRFQKDRRNYRRNQEYKHPTLIYVFGKMEEDLSKKYIRTEDDAIRLIEKWMRMDVEENNELLQFIRSKRLLALGCKYDDWYFRFFWYVLTGDINTENFDGTGEVAFHLNVQDPSESRLQQFLDRTNICVLGETRTFINNLLEMLTIGNSNDAFRNQVRDFRKRNGIFISYCNKDAIIAGQLFYRLVDKGFNVWLDSSRLYGGDNYEEEISDAIAESQIFIPILSINVSKDLSNNDLNHYYIKEWKLAQQIGDKVIIPLAINGYDLKSDYHKTFETIVNQTPSGIDLMDSDGFHKLLNSLNRHA